ncbi:serine hydrolase domain-containing protein [Muricauda sp. ANG21]|uniref:serine hydrolase domain-containing protein n=1 Tax=Allomuricauda sp. ANG21 TaxID=3042468 RepID=UPI003452C581
MKRYVTVAVLVMAFFVGPSSSGLAQSTSLNRFIRKKMQKADIAGLQAAFISNGRLAWSGSFGYRDFDNKVTVNDSTLFLIASCSKPITALGLMKLYDNGRIDLDEDINNYLPFKIINPNHPKSPITFRMLLVHTSSLKDNTPLLVSLYTFDNGGDSTISLETFIKDYFLPQGKYYDASENFLTEEPGSAREYSNAGYALIGYLVQQISGKRFSDFMHDEVFMPLGMESSYWFLNDIPHGNVSRPHEYVDSKKGDVTYKVLKHYGFPDYPDGQLRTNVSDYAKFVALMLGNGKVDGGRFLQKSTIEECFKVQFPKVNKWQAIAWNYDEFYNWLYYMLMPRFPSHTGVDPGVATVVSLDRKTGNGAILFANTLTHNFKGHKALYLDIIKRLLKEAKKSNR